MPPISNQRGEYGPRRPALTAVGADAIAPASRRAIANHVIIGVGVFLGVAGWPLYKKREPLGVITLGASGSMVSAGILGLLLDQTGGPS